MCLGLVLPNVGSKGHILRSGSSIKQNIMIFLSFKVIENSVINRVRSQSLTNDLQIDKKNVSCNPEIAFTGKNHKDLSKVNFRSIWLKHRSLRIMIRVRG